MSTYSDTIVVPFGTARVVDESAYSDGTTALRIHNWNVDERGQLDSTFHIMPLIGLGWTAGSHPDAFDGTTGRVIGMTFARFYGEVPEILFVCTNGIYRFAPWLRNDASANGALLEQKRYDDDSPSSDDGDSVTPVGRRWYPPQFEQVGNRVYITLGDGGRVWVWDGHRLRDFGYGRVPAPPEAVGPNSDTDDVSNNDGGFSVQGRIGTTDMGIGEAGGIDEGQWRYALLFENPDGSYSETSPLSNGVYLKRQEASAGPPSEDIDKYRRRFWLRNIARGPDPTAARVLLRTPNLKRLPEGTDGSLQFLTRIPNNVADEWVDDMPDGELGPVWENRVAAPQGFYFLAFLNGSLFCFSTDGNPSRCWWSEQTSINGPTPESFIEGHWSDIYPGTGSIRGVLRCRMPTDQTEAAILVFKERAVHFVTGSYPDWTFGTLHEGAGLCGPNLVQAVPDGSILWFGSGTFWRMDQDGLVQDVGGTIRKSLSRVNLHLSMQGSSYVDARRGEVRFFVCIDDQDLPKFQFIWDYRFGGWRTAETVETRAALRIEEADLTLLAGTFNSNLSVYVLGRTYSKYTSSHPTAIYQSGWVAPGGKKRQPHSTWIPKHLTLTMEERSEYTASIVGYVDWNLYDAVTTLSSVPLHHPEETVPFYSADTSTPTDIAYYGTDVYRTSRVFTLAEGFDVGTSEVVCVTITVSNPMCLLDGYLHGHYLSGAVGRSPQVED